MMKKDIASLLPQELEKEILALGAPRYRAVQIFQWIMRGVRSFDEMKDLPAPLREKLSAQK